MSTENRLWFYYAGEQQVGPIAEWELHKAVADGVLGSNDYVYREGFAEWKFLKDVKELSQGGAAAKGGGADKRLTPRAAISELVVAHNDNHIASGSLSNISITGLFFRTDAMVFRLKEEVKLTLKEGRGLGKPLHLRAQVVRQVTAEGHAGYGLELKGIDDMLRNRIEEYIRRNASA